MSGGGRPDRPDVRARLVASAVLALALLAPLGVLGGTPLAQIAAVVRHGPLGLDDYFQDWASGRNALAGRSLYEPLSELANRYLDDLGRPVARPVVYDTLPVNAHPPFAVLSLLPLSRLAYADAWRWFTWLNLLGVLGAIPLCLWALGTRATRGSAATRLAVHLALVATSSPLFFQTAVGNLEGVLVLCLAGAFALRLRGRPIHAAALLGVASLVKIVPLLFVVPMLAGRRRQEASALLGTVAAGTVATVAAFGWADHLRFVEVAASGSARWSGHPTNVSLSSFVRRLSLGYERPGWPGVDAVLPGSPGWTGAIASLVVVGVLAWGLARIARDAHDDAREFSLVLLLALVASPMTWIHSLLLAYPAVAWLWSRREMLAWRGWLVLAGVALLWCDERVLWSALTGAPVWPERFSGAASLTLLSADTLALLALTVCAATAPGRAIESRDRAS